MSLSFGNFIVIEGDDSLNSIKRGYTYDYTMSGVHIFEPGSFVPVIKVGDRCIGIGKIVTVLMTETTTTVQFMCAESASRENRRYDAYYDLFKLAVFNADPEEAMDMGASDVFPGNGPRHVNSDPKKKRSEPRPKVDYGSLFGRERY